MTRLYANLRKRVMGLKCSQHRAFKMKQVLAHYNQRFGMRAKKELLLKLMVSLEGEIPKAEKKVIRDWMVYGTGTFEEAVNAVSSTSQDSEVPDPILEDSEEDIAPPSLFHHITAQTAVLQRNSECSVCMESFARDNFPSQNVTASCNHEVTVCTTCTRRSVEVQMEDQPYNQVSCPECPERLAEDGVGKFSDPENFARYTKKGFIEAIEKMEGYTKCLAPDCESGQLHGSGHEQPIMTCVGCGFKTCYTHMMPWHTDKTCAQYDKEQRVRWELEEASKRVVAKTAKPCPNTSCGYFISKNGGCDHMTCRRCMHEFCWLCMAPYSQIRRMGNSAHDESCQYHSAKLPEYN